MSRLAAAVAIVLALVACQPQATVPSPSAGAPTSSSANPTSPAGTSGPSAPATTGGSSQAPGPSPSIDLATESLPSRASLIRQAEAEGRLDPVTALEYRAMAMYGLPGLPDEFQAGVPRSDTAAFTEMAAMMDSLSPGDQARFRPFLVRPTEPGSIFSTQTGAIASLAGAGVDGAGGPGPAVITHPTATCTKWDDSKDLDNRFKVWACADSGLDDAELDIATVAKLIADIWPSMTAAEPAGMGPPLPDGVGGKAPAEYGGDARIDFYILDLGQVIYRDGPHSIPVDAAAATISSPPFTNPDGTPRNSSSAFVLVNRERIGDEVQMKLDLIHEFFHALQDAHNRKAPVQGTALHWFVEASAKWAETWYLRPESWDPHTWFISHFQPSEMALDDPDEDHQYASYIWPFFMQQETRSEQSIFKAWAGTDQLQSGDFAGVTAAVDAQLPFAAHFRDFAVRNLNLNEVALSAHLTRYEDADANFYDDSPPVHMGSAFVSPGEPWVTSLTIPELDARYEEPTFTPDTKKVRIDLRGLQPSGQVDGDALLHKAGGGWVHQPISGGLLEFCRDDPGQDYDRAYLVLSNHGVSGTANGTLEVSGKDTCERAHHVGGTITWDTQVTDGAGTTSSATGSMHLVLLADPEAGFSLEPGPDNTYEYTYTVSRCSPTGQFSGPLDSERHDPGSGYGWALPQGKPGQDMAIAVELENKWTPTCDGTTAENSTPFASPTCKPAVFITGLWDGKSSYVFRCQAEADEAGLHITGHLNGTLVPLD